MEPEPLALSLSFSKQNASNLMDEACSSAVPSALTSWGLESTSTTGGIVMGCEDGSVFFFNGHYNLPLDQQRRRKSSILLPPASPTRTQFHPHSHSHSHIHGFNPQSTAQPTSAISTEQISAPTNYVDYDSEPEKLKGLLKNHHNAVRDSTFVDAFNIGWRRDAPLDIDKEREYRLGNETIVGTKREKPRRESTVMVSAYNHTSSRSSTPSPSSSKTKFTSIGPIDGDLMPGMRLTSHFIPSDQSSAISDVQTFSLSPTSEEKFILSLQESGTLNLLNPLDGTRLSSLIISSTLPLLPPSQPSSAAFKPVPSQGLWKWKQVKVTRIAETTLIMLLGIDASPLAQTRKTRTTRCLIAQLSSDRGQIEMKKIGDWILECGIGAVGFVIGEDGNTRPKLHYTSSTTRRVSTVPISLKPPALPFLPQAIIHATPSVSVSPLLPIPSSPSLTATGDADLSNHPFKNLRKRLDGLKFPDINGGEKKDGQGQGGQEEGDTGLIKLGEEVELDGVEVDVGDSDIGGVIVSEGQSGLVVVWHEDVVVAHVKKDKAWETTRIEGLEDIRDVVLLRNDGDETIGGKRIGILHAEGLSFRSISASSPKTTTVDIPLRSLPQASHITPSGDLLTTRMSRKGTRRMMLYPSSGGDRKGKTIWSASSGSSKGEEEKKDRITVTLPLELGCIVVGFSSGDIGVATFHSLPSVIRKSSSHRLRGEIVHLESTRNVRTGQKILIGGADDGSVAIWDFASLDLIADWTVFISPLRKVLLLDDARVGSRLRGNVFCIAEDGTIVTISPDGPELLHVIPASSAPLLRICLGEDNLLLLYGDGRARLWDVKTLEFWRSMDSEKAKELIGDGNGDWFDVILETRTEDGLIPSRMCVVHGLDSQLSIPIELSRLENKLKPPTSRDKGKDKELLLSLLAMTLPKGLSHDVDGVHRDLLGSRKEKVKEAMIISDHVGIINGQYRTLQNPSSKEWWSISSTMTTVRLVFLLALLRFAQGYVETEKAANHLIAFYTASLRETVGHRFKNPSVPRLSRYWYHPLPEVRQSARSLFDATVASLENEEAIAIIEEWQHRLPCLQPDAHKADVCAAQALLITGHMVAEKYALVSPGVLTDIAKSVALYLHDDQSPHRVIAIDLCARAFHLWQNHVDAMNLLRSLITLATSDALTSGSSQARIAVLQIAASSTPLFMTTLALDIMQPRSIEQQKSIMQLVAFLIRKRPLVLYPNLPRLAEAVVKSLDPNSANGRDAIMDAATEILSQIVKTYPSVDFHMGSQRLAVGTNEGAVVLYDLKSATRLYVLEGHTKRIDACSFSADGRRLVTTSLEERVVLVWKVGTSFSSIFNPGAPPRQGHGGTSTQKPYKTLNFSVGDEGNVTIAAILESVKFEWPGDRNARLTIGEIVLTFNA